MASTAATPVADPAGPPLPRRSGGPAKGPRAAGGTDFGGRREPMQPSQAICPVVMSGGTGTGLWPLSREAYPKQFLPITSKNTLLQETVLRTADRSRFSAPVIVANDDHRFIVADQLRQLGIGDRSIIVEPTARGTGPAAAVSALFVQARDPDALMLMMPVDHAIADEHALLDAVEGAVEVARAGRIVLFGVKPTAAATQYGYIRTGSYLTNMAQVAESFVEKPDEASARAYVDAGRYLWNSGIVLASAGELVAEFERCAPEVMSAARRALEKGTSDLDFLRLELDGFRGAPPISMDRALLERTDKAAVIALDCGWTDIGSWSSLYGASPHDSNLNLLVGNSVSQNSTGCHVRSEGPLVATVGVQDLVVVATDDVVLVTRDGCDADVRRLVQRLKRDGRGAAVAPRRVYCPWGYYESIHAGYRFQVKRITVNPGGKLSLQKHFHRAEHWVVVNGTAQVTREEEQFLVRENESVYMPLGTVHRLENPGKLPLNLVEVQSGAYLGEDDIIRFDDIYQRV